MRLLLDTHVAIWALADPDSLPEHIREIIDDEGNQIYVSIASLWEIAVNFAKYGRTRMPLSASEALAAFEMSDYDILDVRTAHVLAIAKHDLPKGDPFDRLILAQALSEPLYLVTKDRRLASFGDNIISW
jgi:PIN domain nuclease of toxin-antitoxin system